jgi:phospholipase/carboxylesterase
MDFELSAVEIPPQSTHTYSVIWLHGLGADGHDFEGIVPELHLNAAPSIRFIFPNAPVQPVTINGGMKMRAWYDILDMSMEHKVDSDGIYQSSALINTLIEKEMAKGVASKHILLAGFSQGGVIALHAGLRCPHKLAGIIALSAYLPTLPQLKAERSSANLATPIFMAHGIIDPVVAVESGKTAFQGLQALAYPVEWHDYVMEHAVCQEEIAHISTFMNSVFACPHSP